MAWLRKRTEDDGARHLPEEEAIRRAEEELLRSEQQLQAVENRDGEVVSTAEALERIGRENNIGPRFFDALGIQRRKRA